MNKQKFCIYLLFLICLGFIAEAQETFPRNDVLDNRSKSYAFIHATIHVDGEQVIEDGTMLIKSGNIEYVGADIVVSAEYTIIDLEGKHLYPSFIELHSSYGLPEEENTQRGGRGGFGGAEQIKSNTKGAYNANESIRSHYRASEEFSVDSKSADPLRKAGFGSVITLKEDGLARGTSALVTLNDQNTNESLLIRDAAAHYSFNRGSSRQNYPRSMMGYISLLRQTFFDAEWYENQSPKPFADQTLEAWIAQQSLPQIFDAGNWLNVLRADKIGDEFGVQYIIKSGGNAYQRIDEVKATGASLIVPLNFPDAYDVDDPIEATKISLEDMKHWELAPTNPVALETIGIQFAFTSDGLRNKSDLLQNIRKAIKHGLTEQAALQSLTQIPANLVGIGDRLGSLEKGKIANFLVTSGSLFDEKTIIHQNWVQGHPYRFKDLTEQDHSGRYIVAISEETYDMEISGPAGEHKAKIIVDDSTSIDVNSTFAGDLISINFKPDKESDGEIRLSGWTTESGYDGMGQLVDGSWIGWSANKGEALSGGEKDSNKSENPAGKMRGSGEKEKKTNNQDELGSVIFPFIAYGNKSLPKKQTILIQNATVWTNESDGIMEETDVLLVDGKIARIGKNLRQTDALVIDGTGKHLTSGIIDEHSHIAGGGNDGATNSSMVRIGDQLNSEQINIYRALSGGVTAIQVLHGSANPIGGQSALIKLRWGESPENLKIEEAAGFIKFALGENVKRASNENSIRYPQSRMGVEQVYVDAFTNALEYEKKWKSYKALPADEKKTTVKPRRDLVHETMLEIIRGERFITCHSYVQSEINMLMKVAERFNFRINTFTHILEGYKVADKMAAHGVGASTFSDWWNYKWEVRYAIPYNAAIMHREGVVTAINSDDSDMMRRLNQEAAKSIKYGDLSEEDAWKMVTLNPAKLLHIDDRVGSIKVGKDADVVLWTDHPLSVYARAQKTIIDGTVYFDLDQEEQKSEELNRERIRLIQKMKGEKKSGSRMQRGRSPIHLDYQCEDHGLYNFHHKH